MEENKKVWQSSKGEPTASYSLNLPDNLKDKGIMEFIQPILEENTSLKETIASLEERNEVLVKALNWFVDYCEVYSLHFPLWKDKEIEMLTKAKEALQANKP